MVSLGLQPSGCPFSDDDSEPILGQWFEETISPSKEKVAPPPPPPPPPLESSPRVKSPNKPSAGENGNILASRKDPELVSLQGLFQILATFFHFYFPLYR